MAVTNSYLLIFILVFVALANVFWVFLLPAKGEKNQIVRLIYEMERTIKSSDNEESLNWAVLKKRTKQLQSKFGSMKESSDIGHDDYQMIDLTLRALNLFIEGNWRYYEIGEDPDKAASLYKESLNVLNNMNGRNSKVTVFLGANNVQEINLGDSIASLKNSIQDQLQHLEENERI